MSVSLFFLSLSLSPFLSVCLPIYLSASPCLSLSANLRLCSQSFPSAVRGTAFVPLFPDTARSCSWCTWHPLHVQSRQKLATLTPANFTCLVSDILDEAEGAYTWHPLHVQSRHKLATLTPAKFTCLVSDILDEAESASINFKWTAPHLFVLFSFVAPCAFKSAGQP